MFITYALLALTVAISFYAWNKSDVMRGFIFSPYLVRSRGQYYRFITSGFIHQDHLHLIMNMITLYFFGTAVEQVFGFYFGDAAPYYFIALYLLGIIVSDVPTFFRHSKHPHYNSLGASGGVAAIIFAFIVFRPLDKIYLYFAIGIPGFILGTLYVIFSWYQGRKANDNINHDAHLYGALFGFLYCILIYPPALQNFIEQIKTWRLFD